MAAFIQQRTLKNRIGCTGVGLHSGVKVQMLLHPAAADSGIRFKRTDIAGGQTVIQANWRNVVSSQLCSTIADADGVTVKTIEHLMAAFAGAGIDNALVEINGPEVPIMDGSAEPFQFLIECAGTVEQESARQAIKILKPVRVADQHREASLAPGDAFSIDFTIEFASRAIASQDYWLDFSPSAFRGEVSGARTFGFEHEVAMLRSAGMLLGGSLDNAVVVSGDKVLNDSGLRYPDEFVRHKVLDSVGDLYLAGAPIIGHFRGVRSGHAMNHRLLEALFDDPTAWELVPMTASTRDEHDVMPPVLGRAAPSAMASSA